MLCGVFAARPRTTRSCWRHLCPSREGHRFRGRVSSIFLLLSLDLSASLSRPDGGEAEGAWPGAPARGDHRRADCKTCGAGVVSGLCDSRTKPSPKFFPPEPADMMTVAENSADRCNLAPGPCAVQAEELDSQLPGGLAQYVASARRLLEQSQQGGHPLPCCQSSSPPIPHICVRDRARMTRSKAKGRAVSEFS